MVNSLLIPQKFEVKIFYESVNEYMHIHMPKLFPSLKERFKTETKSIDQEHHTHPSKYFNLLSAKTKVENIMIIYFDLYKAYLNKLFEFPRRSAIHFFLFLNFSGQ